MTRPTLTADLLADAGRIEHYDEERARALARLAVVVREAFAACRERGIAAASIARQAGVSTSYVCSVRSEAAGFPPTPRIARALAEMLNETEEAKS